MKTPRQRLLATTLLTAAAILTTGAAITAIPTVAAAQDLTSGTLEGRLVDSSGKPVAGAKVTVTSNSRGFSQTLTSDANGVFRVTQLPIGSYAVTASAPGFSDFADRDLAVNLGAVSHYDLPMDASGTVSAVVVTGRKRAPSVDFDKATTGMVVDVQQTAEQLPVSRDIQGILSLAPQITISKSFASGQLTSRADNPVGDATIAGSSAAENIFYINGMNVTNFRNFLGGSTIPFDFYDQVEIKTGGYSAEYGRSTGGAIIAVSRSGSNDFHGGVNAYWSPEKLSASQKTAATLSKDLGDGTFNNTYALGLNRQNKAYEGNVWLSGPIWKDRLFFFGFYNPRNFETVTGTASSVDAAPNSFSNKRPDVYDVVSRTDPFYGGRIDFNLTDRQRFAATIFRDDQNSVDQQFVDNGTGYDSSITNNYSGGLNKIFNYTGKWTDWFTLSALYGETEFKQSSIGELDGDAAVFSETAGALVRGNPNLLIASGTDTRKNYRVDGDFYFPLFGDHHVRVGYDKEELNASQAQSYSGGVYYRYYPVGTNCGSTGTFSTSSQGCVRVRQLFNVGSYGIVQQGYYLQDAWTVTDRLSLQLGVRVEDFNNKNASGDSFVHLKNQIAPRIAATYDLFGDRSTKISAFYGRYHLPVAGNTNIRGSGGETFQEDFYLWSSRNATTLVPTLGTLLSHQCLEGTDTGSTCEPEYPAPATLRSANLKPQYQDEFIVGAEHIFQNNWRVSANLIYRKLQSVLEDTNLNNPIGWAPDEHTLNNYCIYAHISIDNCGSFGNSGYVLINPGKDVVLTLNDSWGGGLAGTQVTIPASVVGLPQAKRSYQALEIKFARPWDGKWTLQGSYVLSRTRGNYEGGVKSDNSQPDTGGTQDFDQPGWMDGSTGLLPNNHTHQFKVAGAYQIMDNLRAGALLQVISPRSYGCLGYFPVDPNNDHPELVPPRADSDTLTAWYCNSTLTPRGSQFKGDWVKNLDLNLTYTIPQLAFPGTLELRADVFNVFNSTDAVIFNEFGETGGEGTRNYAYHTPAVYNDPRTFRVGVNYRF